MSVLHCRSGSSYDVVAAVRMGVSSVSTSYSQMVVLVGIDGAQVRAVADDQGVTESSIGAEIAHCMIEVPSRDRPHRAIRAFETIVASRQAGPIILTHIEVLFEPALRIDPLRLLKQVARDKPIIVVWPGKLDGGDLVYAEPGHPEYRRDSAKDLMVVAANEQRTTA